MSYFDDKTYSLTQGQKLTWSYYDFFTLAAATRAFELFTVLRTAKSQGNLPAAGQIPAKHLFWITKIKGFYIPDEARTQGELQSIIDFMRNTSMTFFIAALSNQLEINLIELFGMHLPLTVTGAAAGDQVALRNPIVAEYDVEIPIILSENTSFKVPITLDAASAAGLDGDVVQISLCGQLDTGR